MIPALIHTAQPSQGQLRWRRFTGLVDDGVLLVLLTLFFPAIILIVGTPIALVIRALLMIAQRLFS